MLDKETIEQIFCTKIEFVEDKSRVTSYATYGDPVLYIRYDRIILRDSYKYYTICIGEKSYVNIQMPQVGIITEISLILYTFERNLSDVIFEFNNYLEGVPYFTFKGINDLESSFITLTGTSTTFYKYKNALVINFYNSNLNNLYWIKTDNIYFGLEMNELKAIAYDVPNNEEIILANL